MSGTYTKVQEWNLILFSDGTLFLWARGGRKKITEDVLNGGKFNFVYNVRQHLPIKIYITISLKKR